MRVFDTQQLIDASVQGVTYAAIQSLDLYDSPALSALATQAQAGRQLQFKRIESAEEMTALPVVLCEDDYTGWVSRSDLAALQPAPTAYVPPHPSLADIQSRIPLAIAFAQSAMTRPNGYLWGGTLGPNYDCSGLVQHAFSTQGIWLPRDAYQQEAFVQKIENPGNRPEALTDSLKPGDLIFFGTPLKATHVAIYLGNGDYIHSSGKDQGRNGIGIDSLTDLREPVSQTYYAQFRGAGRVVRSYQPRSQ
jgi:cell wall-associated NlpC family hydrolase